MNAKLLTPHDVTRCKQLSESDYSDAARAKALLAIHYGETQMAAALSSGLTLGQVRYILSRYRQLGATALSFDSETLEQSETSTKAEPSKRSKKNSKTQKKKKTLKKEMAKAKKKDKKKDKNKKKDKEKKER
jgi:hypothetical protein